MQLIGHRGAPVTAPENTLAAFRAAWLQGADGIELDVHMTSDQRVIVCHDATTTRTTGRRLTIARSSAAALQRLDAGGWKARRWSGERLPLLEEVLAGVPGDARVLVEIKCGPEIGRVLARMDLDEASVGFLCFDEQTLRAIRRALPCHACLWNIVAPARGNTLDYASLIVRAQKHGFTGLSFGWHEALTGPLVGRIHDAGLDVAVWAVPGRQALVQSRDAAIDMAIVDHPGRARKELARG